MLPREDLSRMAHEEHQELELARRERSELTAQADLVGQRVDLDVARDQRLAVLAAIGVRDLRRTDLTRAVSSLGENGFVT